MKMSTPLNMGKKLQKMAEERGLRPVDIAKIFNVKAPSVYDWYEHGRIHKKHFEKLVEWSGQPITWWLDFTSEDNAHLKAVFVLSLDKGMHETLLSLFNELSASQKAFILQTLRDLVEDRNKMLSKLARNFVERETDFVEHNFHDRSNGPTCNH